MSEIEDGIRSTIESKLAQIENDFCIEIILAVESGSRAWGFESTDSDYDVRFIYKHSLDWYICVTPKRDVIELPITSTYDFSGWDINKALFLLSKSNPVLFEWLKSPLVYKRKDKEVDLLLSAANEYFNPRSCIYHYLSMAKANYREYLKGEYVKLKKYFYALRPVLACIWIEEFNEIPPIEFSVLLKQITQQELIDEINSLLRRKKSGIELGEEKRIDCINSFIESNIIKYDTVVTKYDSIAKPTTNHLNTVLLNIIKGDT